jgi:hypothetical protein
LFLRLARDVHEQRFHTYENAQAAAFEFIQMFYNGTFLQTLGYVNPMPNAPSKPFPAS